MNWDLKAVLTAPEHCDRAGQELPAAGSAAPQLVSWSGWSTNGWRDRQAATKA